MSADAPPEVNSKPTKAGNEYYKSLCDANSATYLSKFHPLSSDFYKSGDQVPIRTISLRFVIVQRSDGSGNFQNTPDDINYLKYLVERANDVYQNLDGNRNNVSACDASQHPYCDSKIRLSLDTIEFVQDDYGWNCDYVNSGDCNYGTCPGPEHYLIETYGKDLHKTLNILIRDHAIEKFQLHDRITISRLSRDQSTYRKSDFVALDNPGLTQSYGELIALD